VDRMVKRHCAEDDLLINMQVEYDSSGYEIDITRAACEASFVTARMDTSNLVTPMANDICAPGVRG
jgi:hypothetical protein